MTNETIILEPPNQRIAIQKDQIAGVAAYTDERVVRVILTSGQCIAIEDEDPNELFEQICKEIWP